VLVARRGGLSAMVLAMRTHPTALALQEEACRLIANLAENGWGFSRGVWFTLFGLPRVYGPHKSLASSRLLHAFETLSLPRLTTQPQSPARSSLRASSRLCRRPS
jgi:hypothetical protein